MPEPGDFAIELLQAAGKLVVSGAADRKARAAMVQGEGAAAQAEVRLPIT